MTNTRKLIYAALMTAVIIICSWISIPAAIPFTLQTFAVFCTFGLLGFGYGSLAVAAYILLGAFGLPVFSGFMGGVGRIMGPTGGYILGFLLSGVAYWLVKKVLKDWPFSDFVAMLAGLIVCYAFGTIWFVLVYTKGPMTFGAALAACVVPFIIPDLVKIIVADRLVKRVRPLLYKENTED